MLSEFAGAAQSLGAGAILVNPWNITDMAAAIQDALTMSEQVPATYILHVMCCIACCWPSCRCGVCGGQHAGVAKAPRANAERACLPARQH